MYLGSPKISQSFIEFNITIEEPENMEKTVLFIFNAKNKENGAVDDEGEADGPETLIQLGSQVSTNLNSQVSDQIEEAQDAFEGSSLLIPDQLTTPARKQKEAPEFDFEEREFL